MSMCADASCDASAGNRACTGVAETAVSDSLPLFTLGNSSLQSGNKVLALGCKPAFSGAGMTGHHGRVAVEHSRICWEAPDLDSVE